MFITFAHGEGKNVRAARMSISYERSLSFNVELVASPRLALGHRHTCEQPLRQKHYRHIHHVPIQLHRGAACVGIGLHYAAGPGQLDLGGSEDLVDHAHLARMDAQLAAEAETLRAACVLVQQRVVLDAHGDTVNCRPSWCCRVAMATAKRKGASSGSPSEHCMPGVLHEIDVAYHQPDNTGSTCDTVQRAISGDALDQRCST